jgi:hypothetical protein
MDDSQVSSNLQIQCNSCCNFTRSSRFSHSWCQILRVTLRTRLPKAFCVGTANPCWTYLNNKKKKSILPLSEIEMPILQHFAFIPERLLPGILLHNTSLIECEISFQSQSPENTCPSPIPNQFGRLDVASILTFSGLEIFSETQPISRDSVRLTV